MQELLANVNVLIRSIPSSSDLDWVNLGGGYLFNHDSFDVLAECAALIRARFDAEVYIEPGAAIVRSAGYLVTEILDITPIDGTNVVILDTTVNHMPEVFEFNYSPEVFGQLDNGPYEYILAGTTCLAGDIFGTYRFADPLEVGQRLIFCDAGAYALSKAHRFNGVNLPNIGLLETTNEYRITKTYSYRDFISFWTNHA